DLLGLSRRTVETHRYKLMEKLEVGNKKELIQKAREFGLI
ncbi:MAG: LuxR C-terminal-related transcriptional regulator, partial [Bacteroidota bacterium]